MDASTEAGSGTAKLNEHDVTTALESVRSRVNKAKADAGREDVQLVAVSKTKPMELLRAAYDNGQRHFGENYVQELVSKAEQMPSDIKWHFIGPLQTNKAKALASIANLHVVETVDREKAASALEKAVVNVGRDTPLNVMVQVNTSGEETKSGCVPGDSIQLARAIVNDCPHLRLVGLMTIGAPDTSDEPAAFKILKEERDAVAQALGSSVDSLQLSMGMSGDFEAAIKMGSNSVRVGSTIFGAREYPRK